MHFLGILGDSVFRETNREKLAAILSNFASGWGEVYAVESDKEASALFQQIFLRRQYSRRRPISSDSFRFFEGNFYYKLPDDAILAPSSDIFTPAAQAYPWIGTAQVFQPVACYSSYWACVGTNAYGIVDNLSALLGFLTEEEISYPAAHHFQNQQMARDAAKKIYVSRHFSKFRKSLPLFPIDYSVNEFFVDEQFCENLNHEEDDETWGKLLSAGLFQDYQGGWEQ